KRFYQFEAKHQPLLSRAAFLRRLAKSFATAMVLILISLFAGMCGYHFLEQMAWIDAFANASMILSGMGPLEPLKTNGGKFFAGCYALYSGLMVIVVASVLLSPVVHRVLHSFHIEEGKSDK